MHTDSGPPSSKPVFIPDHTLLRRIGLGSYGEVWLARSVMGMYRAVKIVYRDSFKDERPFQREVSGIRKFEPISRSHEGFVDVLQVGINEPQGYFYYVMELGDDQVAGQQIDPENYAPKTLAKELLSRWRLSFQECLKLGLALSQALAELHKHELVHRDVKPSNIIFVHGVPKLADIGLVAEISEARSYVGTEGFIPPEGPGAPQADVYGLGKVLYEASTGKDRQEFPELPTRLEKFPDHDSFLELNEVIVHACRSDTRDRYASAWDMHADLLVLANGKSVKRLKLLERRLARLKRVAGVSALVLLAATSIGYHIYREHRAVIETRQRQVGANIAYGNRAMEARDLLGALPYFTEAFRLDQGNLTQETAHRLRFGSVLAQCPKLTQMWFMPNEVRDCAFSPDAKMVLIPEFFSKADIFEVQSGQLNGHPFGQGMGQSSAAFSRDGQLVATTSEQPGAAYVWDTKKRELVCSLPHPKPVLSVRFHPDSQRVVTACYDGVARIWDARTGKLEGSLHQHTKGVRFADYSDDGQLIVTASEDNKALVWDGRTGRLAGMPLEHGNWVNYASFSPDKKRIATACADHKARIWEAPQTNTEGRLLFELNHRDGVQSVEFSPDGRWIVTASLDGTVRIWPTENLQSSDSSITLRHSAGVTHASFSPNGHSMISACTDGSVRIWDFAGSALPATPPHESFSLDASRALAISNDKIEISNSASGEMVCSLALPGQLHGKPEFSGNGRFVACVSTSRSSLPGTNMLLQVWDSMTAKSVGPAIHISTSKPGISLTDDGKRVATFSGKVLHIWDASTGKTLSVLTCPEPVNAVLFNRNGDQVATRAGNELRVRDVATGQEAFPPLKHPQPITYAEYSPNGMYLVTCCADQLRTRCQAQVWSSSTGQPIGTPCKHRDGILFASFSPDSRRLATASEDFTAIVWDVASGKQLVPALRHEHQVQSVVFSPDSKWILTASSDKSARVWSGDTGDPLTPPLQHFWRLTSARFLAEGHGIITFGDKDMARIWEFPVDRGSVHDLMMIARLLSGNSVTTAGQLTPAQSESLETIWRQLPAKHPSVFTVSDKEIIAWHRVQAEECEKRQRWFAAAFHLERLVASQTSDQGLVDRLNRAKEKLRK